ncbi:hypothetical protein SCA6_015835 [Theobroma cacao]
MFCFLCQRILHGRHAVTASQSHKVLYVSQNDPSSLVGVSASLTLRCISSSSKKQSFTVSYLKKKCGLSSESALTAAKYVQFATSDRADTVIAFFKNHGFSEPQISRLIKRRPVVLLYDVEKTLSPKLEIVTTLHSLPSTLIRSPIQFKNMIEETKEMGLIPSRPMFMVALSAMSSMSKSTWKKKFEVFKKYGWSEKEALEAFRRYPMFIKVSEDKFMLTMDFLVNKMGFRSSIFAKRPRILMMSLDKKIVPRGLFALDLLSKGIIKRVNLQALLETSDNLFIEKFVNRFKAEESELLKLYQEKLNLSKNWKIAIQKLYHNPPAPVVKKLHEKLVFFWDCGIGDCRMEAK